MGGSCRIVSSILQLKTETRRGSDLPELIQQSPDSNLGCAFNYYLVLPLSLSFLFCEMGEVIPTLE